MRHILPLLFFQVVLLMWLHFAALTKNQRRMQKYLSAHPDWQSGVWVNGAGYSFHICGHCVDAILGG